MEKFASIIFTHYAMNDRRSEVMITSMESLLRTKYPFELIVIDNGYSMKDSEYLLELADKGLIHTYIRNSRNMHFGYARNQALELAQGDYFVVVDNDLDYKDPFWLSKCIDVLEFFPGEKIYSTPMDYPTGLLKEKYQTGELKMGDKTIPLSMRAGSNCFVIRRYDMKSIGKFAIHRIAGSRWTDLAVRKGYLAAVLNEGLVTDMGLRQGYNLGQPIPIFMRLSDGSDIYFNMDEYKRDNDWLHYSQQKSFNS